MPQLILNADDFGQTPGICRAVAELHDAGALTSATLMACGMAFEEAVSIAKQRPSLGVGCHVVLLNGTPTLPTSEVPSLLGPDRKSLRPTLTSFLWALAAGHIREEEIEQESIAQICKLQDAGIHVTHLDTHKHTHMFPRVLRPLLRAAKTCGIGCIRAPFEEEWSVRVSTASVVRSFQTRALRMRFARPFWIQTTASGISTPQGCIGIAATGSLDAATLEAWISALPQDGFAPWEIATHPGYCDSALASQLTRLQTSREVELRALLQVIPRIQSQRPDIQLTHFGNMAIRQE